jgi:hypothetical protein
MNHECPALQRVAKFEAKQYEQGERIAVLEVRHDTHEELQQKQSETLDKMCGNVQRMADSMAHIVSIVPLINMAQAVNVISRWMAPPFAVIAGLWAAGHTIRLLYGKFGG